MDKTCKFLIWIFIVYSTNKTILTAIIPPPWANPKLNPCALQPRGWQLIYWPPDGKCYKIFQTGYPCPNDMELSPITIKIYNQPLTAECRCPPMQAQSAKDGKCYNLYSIGPCDKGFYFAPDTNYNNNNKNNISKRQWGICLQLKQCLNSNEIFWPLNGECYKKFSRGPCPNGQLLILSNKTNLPECQCNQNELIDYYYNLDNKCYQHFTKGPCKELGHLFLPNRLCNCLNNLPHYYNNTKQCYEFNKIGPCNIGQLYQLNLKTNYGICECKNGYINYLNTNNCYRPYTQGPCQNNYILINNMTCIKQPCKRGYLYYPKLNQCFRIGIRGPCPLGQIITFDFNTRPSIDGISYNGICNCENKYNNNNNNEQCQLLDDINIECDKAKGLIKYNKQCYKLYSQGPCQKGSWIIPKRHGKNNILWISDNNKKNEGICECMPGYTKLVKNLLNNTIAIIDCLSPTVILANYLNNSRNFSFIQ